LQKAFGVTVFGFHGNKSVQSRIIITASIALYSVVCHNAERTAALLKSCWK